MAAHTYDEILERYTGTLSFYQFLLCSLASIDAVGYGYYTLLPVFSANIPPHQCTIPKMDSASNCSMEQYRSIFIPQICRDGICENDSCHLYSLNETAIFEAISHGHCPAENDTAPTWNGNGTLEEIECDSWTYEESFYSDTAIKEWDLVCGAEGLGRTISGAYMFGRFLGCLVITPLGDIIGRRKVILITTVISFISAFAGAFVTNVYLYIFLRFILGSFDMARSNTGFVLGIEYIHRSKRCFFSGVCALLWVLGYITLPGIAYLIRQWRPLQWATALSEIPVFLLYFFFLPESPRWLLAKNRKDDVKSFILKLAKYNKRTLPEDFEIVSDKEKETKQSIAQILRAPYLRWATLLCAYVFFACSFLYYGLAMNSSELAGDVYLNFFLYGLIEIPAYLYILVLYNRSARLPAYIFFVGVGGLLLLLTISVPTHMGWLVVVFAMLGKFAITVALQLTWMIVSEIFPTSIRGSCLGITNSAARFGSFISTYVTMSAGIYRHLPTIIYGIVPLIGAGLIFILPETRGITLPQTTEEGEEFLKKNMCRPCGTCRSTKDDSRTNSTKETAEMI